MTEIDLWMTQFNERREARQKAERTFLFCGEQLTHKAGIAPQVSIQFNDTRNRAIAGLRAASEATEEKPSTVPIVTDSEMIDAADAAVRACLEPDSISVWEKLRAADSPSPLVFSEIFQFCDYLIAKCSGLPTAAPSASSNGASSGARSSKAGSSSKAGTRKT